MMLSIMFHIYFLCNSHCINCIKIMFSASLSTPYMWIKCVVYFQDFRKIKTYEILSVETRRLKHKMA